MRDDDFLNPVIDSGSARVFDCNAVTRKLREDGIEEELFFRNPRLNRVIVLKHSVPFSERRSRRTPAVGTKLYFPFDELAPFAGGSTIYLHDRQLEQALFDKCGVSRSLDREAYDEDLRLLRLLDGLPTLDAFLLRDVLETEQVVVNERYLEISEEQWREIESFIQGRFVPIVQAAFPEAQASRSRTRKLIAKLWEGKDAGELAPLITAFQLPTERALEIIYSWKVITFYAFQYRRLKPSLVELAQWLKETEAMLQFRPAPVRDQVGALHHAVRHELRQQWRRIEDILHDYEDGYDKMFVRKTETAGFLNFLKNCRATFWEIGDALGKCDHAVYCWNLVTQRYPQRRLQPLEALETLLGNLESILAADLAAERVELR